MQEACNEKRATWVQTWVQRIGRGGRGGECGISSTQQ